MSEPVTVLVRRIVKPGADADYEGCQIRLAKKAESFEGFQGARLHKPTDDNREYVGVFRFSSVEDLEAFERSDVLAEARLVMGVAV